MNQVILVGAGCGKGSITLRGAELLKRADCVVYDSLLDEELLSLCRPDCEKIDAGKRAGKHGMEQGEINELLIRCGKKYPLTVRLKGGDPFVFGRGGEEMLALRCAGIDCESVPGVTSAVAAAELAGIPVTHRGLSRGFRVLTAHTAEGAPDFAKYAKEEDTLVFLMGKAQAKNIRDGLIAGGMSADMPAAVVGGAGTEEFCAVRTDLSHLAEAAERVQSPLVLLVGKVCALELCNKNAQTSLQNSNEILVTGTESHARRVCGFLRDRGVLSRPCPILSLKEKNFDFVFEKLPQCRWLVFTSANGVEIFFRRVKERGTDLRLFGDKKFAAIGAQTAKKLASFGFTADLVPATYTAQALCERLRALGLAREEILLLRAASGNPVLSEVGVQADLYDTVPDEAMLERAGKLLPAAKIVTFGSAGGARALLQKFALPAGCIPVCIGEEAAREVKGRGYAPAVCEIASAEALADAVVAAKEKICRD